MKIYAMVLLIAAVRHFDTPRTKINQEITSTINKNNSRDVGNVIAI